MSRIPGRPFLRHCLDLSVLAKRPGAHRNVNTNPATSQRVKNRREEDTVTLDIPGRFYNCPALKSFASASAEASRR